LKNTAIKCVWPPMYESRNQVLAETQTRQEEIKFFQRS